MKKIKLMSLGELTSQFNKLGILIYDTLIMPEGYSCYCILTDYIPSDALPFLAQYTGLISINIQHHNHISISVVCS